jgi:hypothetical protein
MTEEKTNCNHDKVYANYALTSNPPQYPWVCRKCGAKGIDQGQYYNYGEYDRIVKEFEKSKPAYPISS